MTVVNNQAQLLDSELQKFRLLPVVLEEYTDLSLLLMRPVEHEAATLSKKLEMLTKRTGAAVIFLTDRNGKRLAASRTGVPTYFVGRDYTFQRKFSEALSLGSTEFFTQGVTSKLPGLFLARRVTAADKTTGVVVVKIEFPILESGWRRPDGPSFVMDKVGRVLITSEPSWRFRKIPNDVLLRGNSVYLRQDAKGAKYLAAVGRPSDAYRIASMPTTLAGSRIVHLTRLDQPLARARTTARLVALAIILVAAILTAALIRSRERRGMLLDAAAALESEVANRTDELRATNVALTDEIERREQSERLYRDAREDLAQASRLATLGQVTAGVAHELNQPIAATRVFADNATLLLARGETERVHQKLVQIVGLADRMGGITKELRASARRRTPALACVPLATALQGVTLLLGERLGRIDFRTEVAAGLAIWGDRVRLEQIIINLLQNALDATSEIPDPCVQLCAIATDTKVYITVADNGSGIDIAVRPLLFTPFSTSKPEGLGLGLSIARMIAQDFGGTLELDEGSGGGTAFRLNLDRC